MTGSVCLVHDTDSCESGAVRAGEALFVIPRRRGDGFQASIRGHVLELTDPADRRLAPTPDDLLVAAVASDLAWSARRFLRDHGLADDVNVSAEWRTPDNLPGLADISVTVTVAAAAATMSEQLQATLDERVPARSLDDALRVRLSCRQ